MRDDQEANPSRFDEPHHGWSPDVGTGGSERATEANRKAFEKPVEGTQSGPAPSEEEQSGVLPTDTQAQSPHGVGESTRTSGEELADDSDDDQTKGKSQRPYGKTDADAGVDPREPVDPESPEAPPA
ncbi:MAG: hypothetical protein ABW215_01010 [Kibdelosporangium sp.]